MVQVLSTAAPSLKFPSTSLKSIQSIIVKILAATVKDLDWDTADEYNLIDLIRLCRDHQAKNCIAYLFSRAEREELNGNLWLGLLEKLANPETGDPVNVAEEPYDKFAGAIISRVVTDLGPKPPSHGVSSAEARAMECSTWCNVCETLRTFFESEETKCCFHQVGNKTVEHVIRQIDKSSQALRGRIAACNVQKTLPRGITVSTSV